MQNLQYQVCLATLLLLVVTATAADNKMEEASKENQFQVVSSNLLQEYVKRFNADDEELYSNIKNKDAFEYLNNNIPLFECPDEDFQRNWYYRWWTFRKHIKSTPDGYVVTEFLPKVPWSGKYNTISCPAGHQYYEGRWLHDTKILDDYSSFWLSKGGEPRRYSFWIADSFYNRYLVTLNKDFIIGFLDDLIKNYQAWEKSHKKGNVLFAQSADRDGMEMAIGGDGFRPTINSYMYGDALAIAEIAKLAGKTDISQEYKAKALEIKHQVQAKLWDNDAKFFKVLRPHKNQLEKVRELHGYTPWYFNLPDKNKGYEAAWEQLMDAKGFYAPYGPTSAEQRHPGFQISYRGHECQWNGPSWPFATSQTLTALSNVLNHYPQNVVSKEDYFETLKIYTKSHQFKRENGEVVSWIDENLNPYTGDWISRTRLKQWKNGTWDKGKGGKERGKDYNHSTYNDLIITGLVGLRPRADNVIEVNPLLPENTWDYFCLDNVRYHDRILTIIWDKTGEKYGKGKGLSVYANGEKIAEAPTLTKLTGTLDGIAPIPYVQRAPAAADKSTHLKVLAARASHTYIADTTSGLIQNSIPYGSGDESIKRWTSWPQTGKSQWVELDLGDKASVKSLGVFWFQDNAGVKVPASWHVEASDDQAGPWLKVPSSDGQFGVELDDYNTVQFKETLKSRYMRIVMTPTKGKALGILSIKIKEQK